jgi:hypothetical protein
MRKGIQTQICRCCYLRALEKLPGMQGDRRVIVREKWYEFPNTASSGVAVLWFTLARVVLFRGAAKRPFRLGYSISQAGRSNE